MAVNLNSTLSWKAALQAGGDAAEMLTNLQANILKGHVRDHLSLLFLHFDDAADGRAFLKALAQPNLMKSAATHLQEAEKFVAAKVPGTSYLGIGLTARGYALLAPAALPADASFRRGMTDPASRATLADPPVSTWEPTFRQAGAPQTIHAVVLVGDAGDAAVATLRDKVLALLPATASVLGEETGLAQRNAEGEGIEHFGYIDGRSQPLFLDEDLKAERDGTDGTDVWDPKANLEQVLVPDPGAGPNLCGSYFVFRKLEQNVRRFKQAEESLADALELTGGDRERAGAMIVGRFEDGTPLTLQATDGAHGPIMNNFTYASDTEGRKCPFHAHIRKTNPRGLGGAQPAAKERLHLMARRGQTYGDRADVPFDGSVPPSQRPAGGVGLLFMAFNSQIHFDFAANNFEGAQFDFMQAAWANAPRFPVVQPAPGLDPVIGQGPRPKQVYPRKWGELPDNARPVDAVPPAVRMRGGEYFFMPSLAFLRNL
jgi:Dyp-type peroxidase family